MWKMALTDKLKAIADAIRSKTGKSDKLTLSGMAEEISALTGGGTNLEDNFVKRNITEYKNDRVGYVGAYAFAGCSSLTVADFPSATRVYRDAFYSCAQLTSINLPKVTDIYNRAFCVCAALTSVDFPSVTGFIGDEAFYSCSKLVSVNIPQATEIYDQVFRYCYALTAADFPLVTRIGVRAFESCSKLASINFPSVTSIGQYAFYGCASLTSVTFAKQTSIGQYAFYGCTALAAADFAYISEINTNVFFKCSALKTLIIRNTTYIPKSVDKNFLSSTLIAAGSGYIYVTDDLVSEYKTEWSTYANQIKPLSEYTGS
jgi:hypothetical protein